MADSLNGKLECAGDAETNCHTQENDNKVLSVLVVFCSLNCDDCVLGLW
jgi:hypothetical protein